MCRYFHPKKLQTPTLVKSHSPAQSVKWNSAHERVAPWVKNPVAPVHDNNNNHDSVDSTFLEVAKTIDKLLDRFQSIALRRH